MGGAEYRATHFASANRFTETHRPRPPGAGRAESPAEPGYYTAYKGKWRISEIQPPGRFNASTEDALESYGFSEFTGSDRLAVPRLPAPGVPAYIREWDLPLPVSLMTS